MARGRSVRALRRLEQTLADLEHLLPGDSASAARQSPR